MKRQYRKQLKSIDNKQKNIAPPPQKVTDSSNIQLPPSSPSIFDSIKQGFGFGLGSSLAHKAIDSMTTDKNNSKEMDIKKINNNLNPSELYELYNKCLEETNRNIKCNDILENKI